MATTLCRTIHSKPVHMSNKRLFHQESSVKVKETFFKRKNRKSWSGPQVPCAGERKTIVPPTAEPGHTQSVGDGVGLREMKASKTSLESTRTKDKETPKPPQADGAGSGRSSPRKLEIRDAISGEPLPAPQRMYPAHDFRMRLNGCGVGGGSAGSLCDAENPEYRPTTTPSVYWPFSSVDTRRGHMNMAAQAPWRRQVFGDDGRLAKMAAFMRDTIHGPSKGAASDEDEDVATSKKRGVWWEIYREPVTTARDSFPVRYSPRLPQPPSRNKMAGQMAGKLGDGDDGARSPFVWQRRT